MPELYVGLMSGTSLDGIDAVLADLSAAPRLVACRHDSFPTDLRDELLALNVAGANELERAARAANSLSRRYAVSVGSLLRNAGVGPQEVNAVGCHGQTVRHDPAAGYTVQLVNGALLAELTDIDIVCDFRGRDIAADGEGAPLVPAFHRAVFHSPAVNRAVVNIGGIANVTHLKQNGVVSGFDCGPGNILLDGWIRGSLGSDFDDRGLWAAQGEVLPELLARLCSDPYFAAPPPKSTGREKFDLAWLRCQLAGSEKPVDVQATLVELTASTIAAAIPADVAEVYVCGGGARNDLILERLRHLLRQKRIATTDELGIPVEWVEALAFAWLAQRTMKREPGNVPDVTGAKGARILGAIYPK